MNQMQVTYDGGTSFTWHAVTTSGTSNGGGGSSYGY
jgi:hypothetical protein